MTDPLTLEMKMRQKLAEAEGLTAKGEPDVGLVMPEMIPKELDAVMQYGDYFYARGIQDTIELLLPDVISWRKTREWLKDFALTIPLDDLEAVISGKHQEDRG